MGKHWMYHDEHDPQIFETSQLKAAEKKGWVDTPAKLTVEKDNTTPRIEYVGPDPFEGQSDDELRAVYEQKRGRKPHPLTKRETLIDGILGA